MVITRARTSLFKKRDTLPTIPVCLTLLVARIPKKVFVLKSIRPVLPAIRVVLVIPLQVRYRSVQTCLPFYFVDTCECSCAHTHARLLDFCTGMGGQCSEIDYFPNATVAEYGLIELDDNVVTKIMTEIYVRGPVAATINAGK